MPEVFSAMKRVKITKVPDKVDIPSLSVMTQDCAPQNAERTHRAKGRWGKRSRNESVPRAH